MKCFYCERPATCLCDGLKPSQRIRSLDEVLEDGLCSRPLCEDHAISAGITFTCRRLGPGKGCDQDTVDYCPECVVRMQYPGELPEAYRQRLVGQLLQRSWTPGLIIADQERPG